MSDYLSQTELGTMFGVSSHAIGKWLIECGLRTSEKKPSPMAFAGGFVTQAPTGRNDGYFYIWHEKRTVEALKAAGHRPKPQYEPPPERRLSGPFEARGNGDRFDIVGSDGVISVQVFGRQNTAALLRLMNLAHKHGQFSK